MAYLTGWATGLRDVKGLNLTAVAVAWNERSYNATFIKAGEPRGCVGSGV